MIRKLLLVAALYALFTTDVGQSIRDTIGQAISDHTATEATTRAAGDVLDGLCSLYADVQRTATGAGHSQALQTLGWYATSSLGEVTDPTVTAALTAAGDLAQSGAHAAQDYLTTVCGTRGA